MNRETQILRGLVAALLVLAMALPVWAQQPADSGKKEAPKAEAPKPEAMSQCAHCGVHFPRSEALSQDGRDYCCEDHRRLGPRP